MSSDPSLFARRVFRVAGIYGLIVIAPLFFLEKTVGVQSPPAITHAEYYYGFAGVTLAWQLVFLAIATDPRRYRPLMLPSLVEKLAAVPAVFLFAQGRLPLSGLCVWSVDGIWFLLFLAAYRRTPAV